MDGVVGWTEDGIITVPDRHSRSRRDVRDPSTGEVLSSEEGSGESYEVEDAEGDSSFSIDRREGKLVVLDPQGVALWETEADARYEIGAVVESPNGEWVALTDSAERLLVVRADGSEPPAVWGTGVYEWSRIDLTWEGTEPPAW